MSKPENAFEIFLLLDKSNCWKHGEKKCLTFAGEFNVGDGLAQMFRKIALSHGFHARA